MDIMAEARAAGHSPGFLQFLELERSLDLVYFTSFNPGCVPGIAQTAAYARVLLDDLAPHDAERRVWVRMERRRNLLAPGRKVHVKVALLQSSLRNLQLPPDVFSEQVAQLIELERDPRVEVMVIPENSRAHAGLFTGNFVLLQGAHRVMLGAYREREPDAEFTTDTEIVSLLERAMEQMSRLAVPPSQVLPGMLPGA